MRGQTIAGLAVVLLGSSLAIALRDDGGAPARGSNEPPPPQRAAAPVVRVPLYSAEPAPAPAVESDQRAEVAVQEPAKLQVHAAPMSAMFASPGWFRALRGLEVELATTSGRNAVGHVLAGTADFALADVELSPNEYRMGAMREPLGDLIIAVVVSPSQPVRYLRTEELRSLLTGEFRDWSEFGVHVEPVQLWCFGSQGMARSYATLMTDGKPIRKARYAADPGALLEAVAKDRGAIGLLPLAALDDRVAVVTIDNIRPSGWAFQQGAYPFGRSFGVVYKGAPDAPMRAFLEFCRTDLPARTERLLTR